MDKKLKRTDSHSSLCETTSSTEDLPNLKSKPSKDILDRKSMEHSSRTQKITPVSCLNPKAPIKLEIRSIKDKIKRVRVENKKSGKVNKTKKKKRSKKKRKRCNKEGCKDRLSRFPIVCCCGHSYCGKHYDKPSHKCSGQTDVDFKKNLKQALPEMRPQKISDI